MGDLLQAQDFEPHLGETFRFADLAPVLTLERVELFHGALPDYVERRPFVLIFRGPKPGPVLAEGLYACECGSGAAFELYVTPIHTPQPDRQDYQSVFN